jgi:hypothetical protein
VIVRIGEVAGHPAVFGAFRTSTPKHDPGVQFATIVLARLEPTGGTLQRQFRLAYSRDKEDVIGGFVVPFSTLDQLNQSVGPGPGRYVVFVFVNGESAPPISVQVP